MSALVGQLFTRLHLPPASAIAGKSVLITGANTGLGKEAARHALALGAASLILGVRSIEKGERAQAELVEQAKNTSILLWQVDLESFASVQSFAERAHRYVEQGGRIDVAIMNAGVASVGWARTADGWERGLQVNVLSTALLSLHLMPLLLLANAREPAATPHLTIVTSDAHKSVKFPERHDGAILQTLNVESNWRRSQAAGGPTERYGVTKLMALFVAMQLARLTPRGASDDAPRIIVNAVAPGFCKSELLTREKAPLILKVVQAAIARTTVEGSKTLLHAVTQGAETHGKWLDHQAIADPGDIATDADADALRAKVWTEIVQVLRAVDASVPVEF